MEQLLDQMLHVQMLNQFWLTLILIIPIVLIARTVVAGTRYSPILIIVVFGLAMGAILVVSDVATPGLPELPIVDLMSRLTVTALIVTFFVGGQEIRKILSHQKLEIEDLMIQSEEEVILGTKRTQLIFILRAFFILMGIEAVKRLILGSSPDDPVHKFYPIIAYIGIVVSMILIDYKASIKNKGQYLRKGFIEIVAIVAILVISTNIAEAIKPIIGLPQIFFAMVISSVLGGVLSNWKFGPTVRSLLFAGIPVVLAANFMVGGSRMIEAFQLTEMKSIMAYGLFGQVFWMFFGLTLLILFGRANHIRNLAPGMAGGLSHSGLTGACTAGDLGQEAASRAPIMINIPFLGHVFVFSILAASAERGYLMIGWAVPIAVIGILLTVWSLKTLKSSDGKESIEVKGLIQFSLGWQLVAVFGSFSMLHFAGMSINDASVATASAISHFGLFAAVQEGMFGELASQMIAFIFAMPFLIHPFVFGMFGKAADSNGKMPAKVVYTLGTIGIIGVIYSLAIV
ncbi:putative membrane protein [Gottschalkia acidurici 9a]|uniref:Membrane protein n=2 Tax=Clostridium acidurici TaxID=1556 RepID=K0B0M8_GOTA9|nr:putative membrane protein [Gottschalkia acidurici 9a]